jgi:hypothetical protein
MEDLMWDGKAGAASVVCYQMDELTAFGGA